MNKKVFDKMMQSVDDELLEEAQTPPKNMAKTKTHRLAGGLVAACVCVGLIGFIWHGISTSSNPINSDDFTNSQIANPITETTPERLSEMGLNLPVPETAYDAVYVSIESDGAEPMAQVTFTNNNVEYTCRALKADKPTDISGIYDTWATDLNWDTSNLNIEMKENNECSWVGWYSTESETQWCLSSNTDALSVLDTAADIVNILGYEMEVAPEGAENISYTAKSLGDIAVAETTFTLDDVNYAYRTASTGNVDDNSENNFEDISETDDSNFANNVSGEVRWCPARIYWNEDGEGKIVWLDTVPGLLYSLHMYSNASEESLTQMALQLFKPAQGDV